MNSQDNNSEFLIPYVCNDVVGRQEQKHKEENNSVYVEVEFINQAPRVFASPKKMEVFLKSLSDSEVASLEAWLIQLTKRCRPIWSEKRFPREKEAFFEMYRQRQQKQNQNQGI